MALIGELMDFIFKFMPNYLFGDAFLDIRWLTAFDFQAKGEVGLAKGQGPGLAKGQGPRVRRGWPRAKGQGWPRAKNQG